jgi:Tfp pilus assembly PilM family ATPase
MTSIDGNVHLGLGMSGNVLRAVEAERHEDRLVIKSVAEATLDYPFDASAVENPDFIASTAQVINDKLDDRSIRAQTVYLALDRRLVLLKLLKVDRGISDAELQDHVEWEVNQMLASPRDEFNVGVEKLDYQSDEYETILIAAVRKQLLEQLRDLFIRTPLNLSKVDLDVLATVRGLRGFGRRHPDALSALVDFNSFGIDFTLIQNGKFAGSSEIATKMNERHGLDSDPQSVAQMVDEELKKLIEPLFAGQHSRSFDTIYLSGDRADMEFIPYLQKRLQTADIRFADPFQNAEMFLGADSDPLVNNNPENFLIPVGMVRS